MRVFTIALIFFSLSTYGQNLVDDYINISKIKNGPSFVTRLTFNDDSTFQYSFQGDLYNDFAEGTYSVTKKCIRLTYSTSDHYLDTLYHDQKLNTNPPMTIQVAEQINWPNPIAFIWPIELLWRRNKLIVVKIKRPSPESIKTKQKLKRVPITE
jgi:hypothetical protein